MAVNLSPIGNDAPFLDANGNPLSGGKLYTYTAGSSTPENTYTTQAGSVANANPVILNSNGYPASGGSVVEIWLTAGVEYKFTLKTSADVTVWERDDISGINDTSVTIDQWVAGPAPTFVSTTSFTLVGDQTTDFHAGRRVKTTNSGGTIYSTIKSSTFGAVTTVVVVNDSGVLDSGLSAVSHGLLSSTNPSTPLLTDAYPVVSGSSDKTKKVRLEVDGLTTDTTRVLTVQDSDDTLVGRATTDTLTNKTLTTPVLNGALSGTSLATQAEMETGTATDKIVSPGTQHSHPSACKGWCEASVAGAADASYNVTSVADGGTGIATITWATDMSGTNYVALVSALGASSGGDAWVAFVSTTSFLAGTTRVDVWNVVTGSQALKDPDHFMIAVLGDQ